MTTWTVYRHVDTDGLLLYIGCTGNLDRRTRAHIYGSPWWRSGGVRVEVVREGIADRSEALRLERELIVFFRPPHNDIRGATKKTKRAPRASTLPVQPGWRWLWVRNGQAAHAAPEGSDRTACGMRLDWRLAIPDGDFDDETPRCRRCTIRSYEQSGDFFMSVTGQRRPSGSPVPPAEQWPVASRRRVS